MAHHDDRTSMLDMLLHAKETTELFGRLTEARLLSDRITRLAVERSVTLIGAAASRVSPATRARHPGSAWRRIVAARNRLTRSHDTPNGRQLADIVRNHLPPLIAELEPAFGD